MYTLGQAAKAAGKSKSTISKAIRNGKISANLDAHGQYQIDPSELFRVWSPPPKGNGEETVSLATGETGANTELLIQNSRLKTRVEALEEHNSLLKGERDDLRRRLDQSEEERRKTQGQLTALLTSRVEEKQARRSFWSWITRT